MQWVAEITSIAPCRNDQDVKEERITKSVECKVRTSHEQNVRLFDNTGLLRAEAHTKTKVEVEIGSTLIQHTT